jgi:hypothetical protein
MGHVRTRGARSIIYIDDLLSMSRSIALGLQQDKFIQETFLAGEWVYKLSKSSGPPSQRVKIVGLIIDSVSMKFCIPSNKLERLVEGAKYLLCIIHV